MSTHDDEPPGFNTLTHARLRAEQGDLPGAAAIVAEILERNPADEAARRLAASLRLRRWLDSIRRSG